MSRETIQRQLWVEDAGAEFHIRVANPPMSEEEFLNVSEPKTSMHENPVPVDFCRFDDEDGITILGLNRAVFCGNEDNVLNYCSHLAKALGGAEVSPNVFKID